MRSGKVTERRKGPDFWLRSLGWLAVVGWLCMFIALILFEKAKPPAGSFFERREGMYIRRSWNEDLGEYMGYLMIAGLIISILGLMINAKRHRRKSDQYRLSLILLGLISAAGIVYYFFFVS